MSFIVAGCALLLALLASIALDDDGATKWRNAAGDSLFDDVNQ